MGSILNEMWGFLHKQKPGATSEIASGFYFLIAGRGCIKAKRIEWVALKTGTRETLPLPYQPGGYFSRSGVTPLLDCLGESWENPIPMDLKVKIQDEMKTAMKAQDSTRTTTLRNVISEIKKREIDKRAPLDEPEILKVISSLIKQRQDSIEAFTKGNRPELAEKEKTELSILQAYLPQAMSKEELEQLVVKVIGETGAKGAGDIGKVMKGVLAAAGGRADGRLVNEIAKAKLTA